MVRDRRVAITGAAGFVGQALLTECLAAGEAVTALVRRSAALPAGASQHAQDLADDASLPPAVLQGVDTLYHLAAVAHRRADEGLLRRVNAELPVLLARQAAAAGVRRFVFLSSVGAQAQVAERPLTEADPPAPATPYGRSKLSAERGLAEVAADSGLEVTVLRPPLVVGWGAPGNLARLATWAVRGRPLPRATLRNRRSVVTLPELVAALRLAGTHPEAAGQTFLVANPEPLSSGALHCLLAAAVGRRPRFLPLPGPPLAALLRAAGRGAMAEGLFGDLQIDPTRIRQRLGWQPAGPVREAVAAALGAVDADTEPSRESSCHNPGRR